METNNNIGYKPWESIPSKKEMKARRQHRHYKRPQLLGKVKNAEQKSGTSTPLTVNGKEVEIINISELMAKRQRGEVSTDRENKVLDDYLLSEKCSKLKSKTFWRSNTKMSGNIGCCGTASRENSVILMHLWRERLPSSNRFSGSPA